LTIEELVPSCKAGPTVRSKRIAVGVILALKTVENGDRPFANHVSMNWAIFGQKIG
jgi:hypothetical protein